MNKLSSSKSKRRMLFLKVSIFIPAGFLFLYHLLKLYNIHLGEDYMNSEAFMNSFRSDFPVSTVVNVQSVFRVAIISSLVLILLGKKIGIYILWTGVGTLIMSQFLMVSETTFELLTLAHSGMKPLKGLILPTIITILFNWIKRRNN